MEELVFKSVRGTVHYWIARNSCEQAPVMVFLHGLTADHTLFDAQVEHFKDNYTVITWDAPGHGLSRPYRKFSYPHIVEDLKGIFLAEGITSAIMVGQSMGGYIIQTLALKNPELIDAFIGIDTSPFGTQYYSKSDLWWLRQIGWMMSCYPYKSLVNAVAKGNAYTEKGVENMRASLLKFDNKAEICAITDAGYKSFIEVNCNLHLTCPVLILVGQHDKTGKVWQYCKAWHLEEDYPLIEIPDAAHNSNVDNPEAVNVAIDDFLKKLALSTSPDDVD